MAFDWKWGSPEEFPGGSSVFPVTGVQFNHQRDHQVQGSCILKPTAIDGTKSSGSNQVHHGREGLRILCRNEDVPRVPARVRWRFEGLPEGRFVSGHPFGGWSGFAIVFDPGDLASRNCSKRVRDVDDDLFRQVLLDC